ncbi:MAG: ABC transporter permease, partial [Limnochordia bacterium]|nr:ABC transporter permease [Limnochordia bacterium]
HPWYLPQYFIPISGMIVGNSMTGAVLGTERMIRGFQQQRDLLEAALMLGATPYAASKHITNEAFLAAITPTVNSMIGMGIVSLPGMMTGQILSGTPPLTAIRYQIAIMLVILGSVSLTVYLLMWTGYKVFFNERAQLIDPV